MANKTKQHDEQTDMVVDALPTDDDADGDDWISSSSAVPSPAPEPDNKEEDAVIYVNQNVRFRPNQPDDTPATPKRSNHHYLPHQRHNPSNVTPNVSEQSALLLGGIHPTNTAPLERPRDQEHNVPTEPSHIHFAREPAHETHPPDARIHQNGGITHHFSPPPSTNTVISAADEQIQPATSVIRISDRLLVDQQPSRVESDYSQINGKQGGGDQITNGIRRTSAGTKLGQDQIDILTQQGRQIAATHSIRPAVPGNNADANGSAHGHVPEGDIGGTSSQRGFGAAPTTAPAVPLMQPTQHHAVDDAQTLPPPSPLVPAALTGTSGVATNFDLDPVPPRRTPRPSLLRRDTTPTAVSRSPMAIDTPPRSHTPPASMSHDETTIANNYKRHSIHAPGGHQRPQSLYQPTSQGKKLSMTSRPGSAQYALSQIHGKNNPLALLIRLNTMQGSNLAAPAVVSPSYEHSERDSDSAYMAMSPTRTRSLRRRASNSSLNSVATMPVISTTAATARGSSASPTSVLAGSSSALLKNLSSSAHSDPTRADTLRPTNDDKALFVSQFYPSNGLLPGEKGKRKTGRGLCSLMAGKEDWKCHETAMKHRGLMNESFNRVNVARAAAVAASTGNTKRR